MKNQVLELAAQKAIATVFKGAREIVKPGTYTNVKVLVEVEVDEIKVGEDYEQRIVQKAQPWVIIAAIKKAIEEAKIKGLDFDKIVAASNGSITKDEEKDAKQAADKVIADLKDPTLTSCKGKVTTKGLKATILVPATKTTSEGEGVESRGAPSVANLLA